MFKHLLLWVFVKELHPSYATFRRGSALSEADCLAGWKPSVYHVLLILGLFAVLLSCCASAMYTSVEGWDYVDSLYFCFVTFSTIGFGDLVSSQHAAYRNQGLYRLGMPGESQGWGRLVGCRLWGRTESDTTEAT